MATNRAKRPRGRPKGSTSRGPTVAVGFRVPKALYDEIERIRQRAEALESKTRIYEHLIRRGLEVEIGKKR